MQWWTCETNLVTHTCTYCTNFIHTHTLVWGIFSKLWHYTGMRKFMFVWRALPLLSLSLWAGQHSISPSQAMCWQSPLSLGMTIFHGLSDGLSTLPLLSTVHTVMKYDLIPVSAALSVTLLSPHCLKLCHSNFLIPIFWLFFPFSLRTCAA